MKGGDHANKLDLRLQHGLARPKGFLVCLRLSKLQGRLLGVVLVRATTGRERNVLAPRDHFLVHPAGVGELPSSKHEEPCRDHRRMHHPAVNLELSHRLGSRRHLLAEPLQHLYSDP